MDSELTAALVLKQEHAATGFNDSNTAVEHVKPSADAESLFNSALAEFKEEESAPVFAAAKVMGVLAEKEEHKQVFENVLEELSEQDVPAKKEDHKKVFENVLGELSEQDSAVGLQATQSDEALADMHGRTARKSMENLLTKVEADEAVKDVAEHVTALAKKQKMENEVLSKVEKEVAFTVEGEALKSPNVEPNVAPTVDIAPTVDVAPTADVAPTVIASAVPATATTTATAAHATAAHAAAATAEEKHHPFHAFFHRLFGKKTEEQKTGLMPAADPNGAHHHSSHVGFFHKLKLWFQKPATPEAPAPSNPASGVSSSQTAAKPSTDVMAPKMAGEIDQELKHMVLDELHDHKGNPVSSH
ncbi:hypothetical protein BASA81_011121 [Batrachochytrium salamandrivorans]|nr:hypothetical protein BASA81_011121 [Batrachochytrium salamandrivorans]